MTDIAEMTNASPIEEGAGEQGTLTTERRNRKGSGLDSMVLPELKQLASSLGIRGIGAMRKSQLIDAIRAVQQDNGHRNLPQQSRDNRDIASALDELQQAPREPRGRREEAQMIENPVQPQLVEPTQPAATSPAERQAPVENGEGGQVRQETPSGGGDGQSESDRSDQQPRTEEAREARQGESGERGDGSRDGRQNDRQDRRNRNPQARENQQRDNQSRDNQSRDNQSRDNQGRDNQGRDWEDDGGSRRSRRRRSRDRQSRRNRGGSGNLERYDSEPVVSEDDVLVPARGILDVLDNYAFVRTNGYLPGPDDAYVSLSMVKKLGLRKGDVVTGVIRTPREGERKEKFNPLVRIDTINGGEPGIGQAPTGVRQAHPALSAGAAEARDHPDPDDRPDHRSGGPDRQGPARPDRLAVQGRQDHDHAGHRQCDRHQQSRGEADGGAGRRAARGGNRLPARQPRAK